MATINNGSLSSYIEGTADDDLVRNTGGGVGGAGNDTIAGLGGNDTLNSGTGNDLVYGGEGDDVIRDGEINNPSAATANTTVFGGAGNDTILLNNDNDFADGGADDDSIGGGLGDDIVVGGAGNDTLNGGSGNDIVVSGTGNDLVNLGGNADGLFIEDNWGLDTVTGGTGGGDVNRLSFAGRDITSAERAIDDTNPDFANLIALGLEPAGTSTFGFTVDPTTVGVNYRTIDPVNVTFGANTVQATFEVDDGTAGNLLTGHNFQNIDLTAQDDTATLDHLIDPDTRLDLGDGNDTLSVSVASGFVNNDALDGSGGIDEVRLETTENATLTVVETGGDLLQSTSSIDISVVRFEDFVTGSGNDSVIVEALADANNISTREGNDDVTVGVGAVIGDVDLGADNDNFNVSTAQVGTVFSGLGQDSIKIDTSATVAAVDMTDNGLATLDTDDSTISGNVIGGGTIEVTNGTIQGAIVEGVDGATYTLTDSSVVGSFNITNTSGVNVSLIGATTLGAPAQFGSGNDTIDYSGLAAAIVPAATNLGGGSDTFTGSNQNDSVDGGAGADNLSGGLGSDTLAGGLGNDTIAGGGGQNTLTGGDGDDEFRFTAGETLTITDFGTTSTGVTGDNDTTNNDYLDMSSIYTSAAVSAANADIGSDQFGLPLGVFLDDISDGVLDGIGSNFDISGTLFASGGSITFQGGAPTNLDAATVLDQFGVVCFAAGTLIRAAKGEVRVEDLKPGDLVLTKDNGYQPLRWSGAREVSSNWLRDKESLRPIVIRKGALGENFPERDLVVSQQHRVLLSSKIALRMFGSAEVLTPAKKLTSVPGIDVENNLKPVKYFHLLFDRHEVVMSNGAFTEALFLGPETRKTLEPNQIEEIRALFPDLVSSLENKRNVMKPGREFVFRNKAVARLIERSTKNRKPLVDV